jgi:hypothetical protein
VATVERATNLHRGELLTTLRAALPGLGVAGAAFVLALATFVVSLFRQPLDLVVSLAGLVVATSLAVAAILAVGPIRKIAVIAAFAFAAVTPSLLLLAGEPASAVVVVLLLAVAAEGARRAVRAAVQRPPAARIPGARVGPSTHPVLLANPRSGGGTAERIALADEAHRRGIEYVVLGPGDDLQRRAEAAVQRGADVLGTGGRWVVQDGLSAATPAAWRFFITTGIVSPRTSVGLNSTISAPV